MAPNGTLTPKQKRFVAAMLTSRTVEDAATAAKVGLRTARRWMKLPHVKAALSEALDGVLAGATRQAVTAMGGALETLVEVHQSGDMPPAARVAAARAILTGGPALREAVELAERVTELERHLEVDK